MPLEPLVRLSLWITAPLNVVAGAAFVFPGSIPGKLIALPIPAHPFYNTFTGLLIGLFGLTYAWLALQPLIVRPLLWFGACGKALAVVTCAGFFAAGLLPAITAAAISGDLLFVILWVTYLRGTRPQPA